ncbi:MAG: ParB/RepB/Spo0J family partition protein, partial [Thermoplasmata archaeon]|nr:ParB/RepB/Spo0J family partition protein [Thermoplasmata archaeon]
MKIRLNQIRIGKFKVREEMNKDYFEELKDSLKQDGQWNPVIVRPSGDKGYELISGHTRFKAAKELGWKEIDATVRDLSDEEAEFLALKTNLVRAGLSEIDEGRVIKKIIDEFQLTQTDIAKRLGKSPTWVAKRLSLVLKVVEEVQEALSKGSITLEHASLIAQISEERFDDWEEKQREFLRMIIKSEWSRDETRIQLK